MTRQLVDDFYAAFARHDGEAMAAAYADNATFEDPVFGELHGTDGPDMWRMLCAGASDLRVDYEVLHATDTDASVRWTAHYTFSGTGRPVRNEISSILKLADGKITDHRDTFSVWRWSSQALGLPGKLLGWTPTLKAKVRKMARSNLTKFQQT